MIASTGTRRRAARRSGSWGVGLLLIAAGAAGSARTALADEPPPPSWAVMERDARVAFTHADDSEIQRIARSGNPRLVEKKTAMEVVQNLYQDVDVVYEGKFHQIEKQRMTLHYERGLTGWSIRGFAWGDVYEVTPGKYPPPPPPPSKDEIEQLVKDPGLADAHIPAEKIEKIEVGAKPTITWDYEKKPIAIFDYPVKVYVQDSVANPQAFPPVVWKTRYICDARASLSFNAGVWDVNSVECGGGPCTMGHSCPDLWKPGAKKPKAGRRRQAGAASAAGGSA
jgi:hypothetical protein